MFIGHKYIFVGFWPMNISLFPVVAVGVGAAGADDPEDPCADVWNDFEKLFNIINSKRTMYGAKCHYRKKILTALSTSSTGHLLRHHISCAGKADHAAKTQYDGSVRNWDYSPEVACVEPCHLIDMLDLPLGIGAYDDAFIDYIRHAHNPRYAPICRQTTTKDFVKHFNQTHTLMMDCLTACSSVAITSHIWNDNAKEDYLSVVAHFVNSIRELEKKLIALGLIDVCHVGIHRRLFCRSTVGSITCNQEHN
jgi:hypothetical protein